MNKTEGIVLRAIDYGETNKIVTLLTPRYGKIAVLAKGANKPQSRLASVSQPFTLGQWLLYGGHAGMASVSQADLMESFRGIREDLHRSAYAACMAELTDRVVGEREPYPGVFQFLLHMFHGLQEGKEPTVLLQIFEMKMLFAAGIQPDLRHCAHCGQPIDRSVRFSVRFSGPLCQACHETDPYAIWMKSPVLKLLRLFQQIDLARLGKIDLSEEVTQQLDRILRQYMEEQGGIYLKSRQFLDQLDKYQL